jgi:hypothetical protein
MFIAEFEVRK